MPDESKSLLDVMLDESAKATTERQPQDDILTTRVRSTEQEDEDEDEPGWPGDVEQLLELSGKDLRAWLAGVSPGDLLCVVAEGSEALRARVLGSLDDESVTWLRDNLKLWDPATDALKAKSRDAVLSVARRLVAEGHIALPESLERDGQDQDTAQAEALDQLTEALLQLVALAHTQGISSLESVVDEAVHPMLSFGLGCVLARDDPRTVEASLHERQRALEAAYRAELEVIRQALVAIARGDAPKVFLSRVRSDES